MTATAPPGTLVGRPPEGTTITVPGLYHNWPCSPSPDHSEWTNPDGTHDGDVIFAAEQATGPMRFHYETVEQLRELALAVAALIAWREATL